MDSYTNPEEGDLMEVSAYCSRFSRRHDFDTFNMSNYQSCENCRHMTDKDQCMVKMQRQKLTFE
ncbi:MAG: hypothetical protein RSD88_05545 [Anaerovoracaceae bacterium]